VTLFLDGQRKQILFKTVTVFVGRAPSALEEQNSQRTSFWSSIGARPFWSDWKNPE